MTTSQSEGFGDILLSSRSSAEYRAMFALTDTDLTRRILDCPSGGAAFTADVCDGGGDVTACDIAYFDRTPGELGALAMTEADRGSDYVRAHREQYRWTFFVDPADHRRSRTTSAQRFAADIRRNPHRYIAGTLPTLPFDDDSFDLALSSHLLFSYADDLDYAFHLAAIRELMRVTHDEVRIFPLVAVGSSQPYARLNELIAELGTHGIAGSVVDSRYEFQVGGHRMLVCRKTEGSPQR
ncbi:methyltransferase domain-containing protein [Nocardia cyriacigeorgica]|uniref:Class I SAM-dependent methyltransferase n=1 Tax=Nocardia cyriacigeorgica TaxID=135487 RepID=A0A5R8NWY5_9NOCA|nr:methyltransferase domain-containing protein [Nocardia cyriacigeorgica]TLF80827.1 class I SAM-dependent methyltransferase [Nocardia cyriacigeorgica]